MAQLSVDHEHGMSRFKEFRRIMFPWVEVAQKREQNDHTQVLKKEVAMGPLQVSASSDGRIRSRMVNRREAQSVPLTSAEVARRNRIYNNLDKGSFDVSRTR